MLQHKQRVEQNQRAQMTSISSQCFVVLCVETALLGWVALSHTHSGCGSPLCCSVATSVPCLAVLCKKDAYPVVRVKAQSLCECNLFWQVLKAGLETASACLERALLLKSSQGTQLSSEGWITRLGR